ncbi:MAG: hypothetical protein ABIC95_01630 [archaeon]
MGYVVIAPVGDNLRALFIGMKEFPTERVLLITPEGSIKEAKDLQIRLEEFTIKSDIIPINGNVLEEMFRVFGETCAIYDPDDLIVNVATGDRMSTCAAISAAYANGLKAFHIADDRPMFLPIIKLSYYNELSDNKMRILSSLDGEAFKSLRDLSKELDMSVSLLSYHINGNLRSKGLRAYRLIVVKEEGKSLFLKLSEMGRLLLKGYLKKKPETE